jgi:hypothetical protein
MTITPIIQAIACMYVFYISTISLNKMTKATRSRIRLAHVALLAGSAAGFASCIAARDVFECLFAVGIALYVAGSRREDDS